MSKITELINHFRYSTFTDEDGNELTMEFRDGVSQEAIKKFETDSKVKLSADVQELLKLSNGMNLFGVEILALEDMYFFESEGVLCFHNWGNGDFDCFKLNTASASSAVYFMDHSVSNLTKVVDSFSSWIQLAIEEIQTRGALYHPMDYEINEGDGMYKIEI